MWYVYTGNNNTLNKILLDMTGNSPRTSHIMCIQTDRHEEMYAHSLTHFVMIYVFLFIYSHSFYDDGEHHQQSYTYTTVCVIFISLHTTLLLLTANHNRICNEIWLIPSRANDYQCYEWVTLPPYFLSSICVSCVCLSVKKACK